MIIRVKKTALSEKPREFSMLVAVLGTLFMLFVSAAGWRNPLIYHSLASIPGNVFYEGEIWRLWTGILIHADLRHFLSNALLFGFFSYLIYGYFGFWVFPASMVIFGGLTNLLSLLTYPDHIRLVGASGLVYMMAGFWLTMYLLIERRLTIKRRLLHVIGVGLVVLMPTTLNPQVSYRTHAIGLAVGIAIAGGVFLRKKDQIRSAEVIDYELDPPLTSDDHIH